MSDGPTAIDSLDDVPDGKEAYCPYCESTNIREIPGFPAYICDDCKSSGFLFGLRPNDEGGEGDDASG